MKISIYLPYEHYEELYAVWAHEETKINFRQDFPRALRCTMSYALRCPDALMRSQLKTLFYRALAGR